MSAKSTLTIFISAVMTAALFIAAVALASVGDTQLAARADFSYVVQIGDSLARIAASNNTTIEALVTLNKSIYPCLATKPICLQVGWILTIPGGPAPAVSGQYTVKSSDSLAKIAQRNSVTVQAIVDSNKTQYPCLANNPGCLQVGWVLTLSNAGNVESVSTATPIASAAVSTADSSEFMDVRLAIAGDVNLLRSENGLPKLDWSTAVAAYAQARSMDMATRSYFSHYDPGTGYMLARQLMSKTAYPNVCENIFGQWGGSISAVAPTAINRWWNSPGHRRCMLKNAATVIGVGVAQDAKGGWLVTLLNARPK